MVVDECSHEPGSTIITCPPLFDDTADWLQPRTTAVQSRAGYSTVLRLHRRRRCPWPAHHRLVRRRSMLVVQTARQGVQRHRSASRRGQWPRTSAPRAGTETHNDGLRVGTGADDAGLCASTQALAAQLCPGTQAQPVGEYAGTETHAIGREAEARRPVVQASFPVRRLRARLLAPSADGSGQHARRSRRPVLVT